LAKADGFQFFTLDENSNLNAIMGDSVNINNVHSIKSISPFPVKFELIRNGKIVDVVENVFEYEYFPKNVHGNYRIVAKLFIDNSWVSWVFTNPIYLY